MELTPDRGRSDAAARAAVADAAASGAKLVPGGPVELLNLSETNAVIEGRSRMAVGTVVTLCLGGPSERRMSARVVRCNVAAIHRDSTMSYQLDIAFDKAATAPGAADTGTSGERPLAIVPPSPALEQRVVLEDLVNEW